MLSFKKGNETEQVFTDTNGNVMNLKLKLNFSKQIHGCLNASAVCSESAALYWCV